MEDKKVIVLSSILLIGAVGLGLYIHDQSQKKRRNEIQQLVMEAERSLLEISNKN